MGQPDERVTGLIQRPSFAFNDELQAVVLYCSAPLYRYLLELQDKGLENLNVLQVAKVYSEIKSLTKTEKEKG